MKNLRKYKTRFIQEANAELDIIFPTKTRGRDKALLFLTVLIQKFTKMLEDVEKEIS